MNLEDYFKKGITVLDFWASWCKPCRNTHPRMIKLFEKYQTDNFNFIGISVDKNTADWERAITKDSLTRWPNILSYKNDRGIDLTDKYNVNSYPTKILIDRNGIVIGYYVGDDFTEFEKKLKEVFGY